MSVADADIPETPYDLGVLFVHGIGQSGQGETLVRFGEPLRAAIEELAVPSDANATGAAPASAQVSVTAAWLGEPLGARPAHAELEIRDIAAAPTRAIQAEVAARKSRWLLAEAWWAEKFPTPTYMEIVSWSFGVLPATLIAHFDRRFRRVVFAFVRAVDSSSFVKLIAVGGHVLWESALLVVALTFTPVVLVAIGALLVIGLAPFKTTRDIAGVLQRKMAATVGDSYVFMRQRITAATISTSVQERLEWLAARCRRVVVVAHSQGGAIAHRVLNGPVTAPCDMLITFGSGLAKLSEIQRGDATRGQAKLWWASFGGALAAVAVALFVLHGWRAAPGVRGLLSGIAPPLLVIEAGAVLLLVVLARVSSKLIHTEPAARPAQRPGATAAASPASAMAATPPAVGLRAWPAALFASLIGVLFAAPAFLGSRAWPSLWAEVALASLFAFGLGVAFEAVTAWHRESDRTLDPGLQWLIDRKRYLEHFEFKNRTIWWYDFYSSADPVPNGHLLDDFKPSGLFSIPVRNSHSMLLDHTSYWQARDDFVERVTRLLLGEAGIRCRQLDYGRAARRRSWRIVWLRVGRWTLGLGASMLAVQWLADPPALFSELVDAVSATSAKDAEGFWRGWLTALKGAAPVLATLLSWLVLLSVTRLSWHRWEKIEIDEYLNNRDYLRAPGGLWWTIAAPLVLASVAISVTIGLVGLLVLTAVVFAAIVGCTSVRWLRDSLQRLSQSGSAADLARIELYTLTAQLDSAARRRDRDTLTAIGERMGWLDYRRATEALRMSAFDLAHANAAWELGRLHERAARDSHDPVQRAQAWAAAIDAYKRGAELGDPISARWAAYGLEATGDRVEANQWYRRAFELGDAAAAHSVGLQLMREGKRDEARSVYEDGVKRGDRLSASALAGHLESLADSAEGDEARALNLQAVRLYRVAFELGSVHSAIRAGNLLRRLGDISAARRSYTLGVRMHDATAALRLGHLEQEVEEDLDAAYRAYRAAGRLDLSGADAAEALLGLGALLEKLGRRNAAVARYREALSMEGGRHASARAGLALARLLKGDLGARKEVGQALQRAAQLAPSIGADEYVEYLKEIFGFGSAAEMTVQQIDGLSAHGLVVLSEMLRFTDPARSRALLERAFAKEEWKGSAEAAVGLYNLLVIGGERAAADSVLENVLAREAYFAKLVAEEFEKQGATMEAGGLRRRADERGSKQNE